MFVNFCRCKFIKKLNEQLNFLNYCRSEPSLRGVLWAVAGFAANIGMFMIFLFGSFYSWRQVAYVCSIVPVINVLVAIFVSIDIEIELYCYRSFS